LPDGTLDWVNDRVQDHTGRDAGALTGTAWVDVIHPEDRDRAIAAWGHSIETGDPYEIEFRVQRHDGAFQWFLVRASALRDENGQVTRWIGTNTDIDARYAAEAALAELNATLEDRVEERSQELQDAQDQLRQAQKMEAIGNLAGGVAHDFNNILQVISGSLQTLESRLDGETEPARLLKQARDAVGRGKALAAQMLSFSRRQTLDPKVVDLSVHIPSIESMLRTALGEGVELDIRTGTDLWNTLIDTANVENALLNLAINSRDAMKGQGRLTISLANRTVRAKDRASPNDFAPGDYVILSVEDTGCGIAPELLANVFEPFFTTKESGRGTGLGLSMVYGFVKQSNGDIAIESKVGEGTRIDLFLPRCDRPAEMADTPAAETAEGGQETLLVVEDDDAVLQVTLTLLRELGYRTLEARDADTAIAIIESGQPLDLVFTDVVMPGRRKSTDIGVAAGKRTPPLPVLFTSGYSHDGITRDGQLDKGVNLLAKPYDQQELALKIREALARSGPAPLSADTGVTLEGLSVLICEDEPIIAIGMQAALQREGCQVRIARSGKAACDAARELAADLAILDYNLPDMKGAELALALRTTAAKLPVIFATGDPGSVDRDGEGATAVLAKPFSDDELLRAVRALLAER